jgi:hypothetical protein
MIPRFSFAARCDIFVCFCEVKIGHSNVSALRKDGSCGARYSAFRRHGVSALPNAAGGRQRKPHGRDGGGSCRRLARMAGYARFDQYTRLRAPGFAFVSRIRNRLAAGFDVHCVVANCAGRARF